MAMIADVIKYEGDNSTFIWKHPSEDFNSLTQLIVHESQEAIFFMNGQALDLFGPGRYTLETQNIPIIGRLLNRITGDPSPFHCEVYFINKTEQMSVKWGTDSKVQYMEPTYGFPISIGASGEMSLRVEDSRKLLLKLVGTEDFLGQQKLAGYFRAFLMTRVKSYIAQVMKSDRISVFEIDEHMGAFSENLHRMLTPDFSDYGISLERFFVTNIVKPDGDRQYEKFKELHFRQYADIAEAKLRQQTDLIDAQTEAQKSSDMFAKCQYMDELTGGKGITFATGTPISNSMTELYTNMRYLQYNTLQRLGLGHFDSWAASFGETQTAIELAPEGTGYRAKTRFAKFFNLPELIALFKESADIQTPDMLKLPVPEADYENIVLKPSEYQQDMVQSLADRAEAVRDRKVDPSRDNMLKITNDGRKLALDQRLINDMLPDEENSKATTCVEKAFEIWEQTKEQKSAQLIFCDLSTPKGDGTFNVYEDIRDKLMAKGVPENEIAFIHNANTETRKAELFAKVRSGQVRFLLGSTAKMGAGTNVQDRLIALHHLDVPWRPSDIEQQEGRILRQGNMNDKVKIFRYVTEGTFDSYSWVRHEVA